jgi:hypothetical protein
MLAVARLEVAYACLTAHQPAEQYRLRSLQAPVQGCS